MSRFCFYDHSKKVPLDLSVYTRKDRTVNLDINGLLLYVKLSNTERLFINNNVNNPRIEGTVFCSDQTTPLL